MYHKFLDLFQYLNSYIELASGFIFSEAECENRTYETWWEQVSGWFNSEQSSSAVEGRNGYLSALHHANRGFTPQTLNVLTIIHNFDLKRDDGTTAAQGLFGQSFPDLFESVVLQMPELPRPRRTLKPRKSKKPPLQAVPA